MDGLLEAGLAAERLDELHRGAEGVDVVQHDDRRLVEPEVLDGVLDPADVAAMCLDAIRDERFLILPHPEVATYVERKATDRDRWLAGMRRFQSALHPDGNLPGDAIAPGV